MTDYNDGKWHVWDGEKCPVHKNSVVQIVYNNDYKSNLEIELGWRETTARHVSFGEQHVIAFRVVKAYREPRTLWAVGKHLHDSKEQAEEFRAACHNMHPAGDHLNTPIVKMVEVLE